MHMYMEMYELILINSFQKIVFPTETCWDFSSKHCKVPLYWYGGFLSVQSSIDAAVIEVSVAMMEFVVV